MGFFDRWPLLRQLRLRRDGNGLEAASARTRALAPRTKGAQVTRSICPYCAVGCGQLVHHRDGRLLAIEGDPGSPINAGTLCPKGAASHQLLTHERRLTRVRYRPPGGDRWQDLDLDRALDMIADRVWETRARTFVRRDDEGRRLNHTTAIAHLGGATLDNEENYLIRKLFTGGLGMVAVSNQARI
ncbi:MAG: dehydrogenase [Planctomycetes bacterium]|nr:dehydrogenase [Planctomycetota bacterium]